MIISRISQVFFVALGLLVGACALLDDGPAKKPAATGLIATPPTYYSTAKARYLGAKYKDNLDRLVERITRNSKTAPLQFANNISSVGGIGFFTHSATKTADERYLEVVLAAPDTFEIRGEHSEKVQRLFSRYGLELLGILNGDSDIYQDQELNGYGLNLAWRNVVADKAGNRVMLERAIIYFRKERVRNFIRQEIKQNDLLADAVIFAVEEDGPLNLVSFRPQEVRQDFRPAIQEDNLAATPILPAPPEAAAVAVQETKAPSQVEPVKPVSPSVASVKPAPGEIKVDAKSSINPGQTSPAVGAKSATASTTVESSKPAQRAPAEAVAINQRPERSSSLTEPVQAARAQANRERQPWAPAVAPRTPVEPGSTAPAAATPMAPAPILEIAVEPAQSLPTTAASNDAARTEKPEQGRRESINFVAPKPTVAEKPAVVIAAPVVKAPAPILAEPVKIPVPTPAPANAENPFPIKQPMIETVRPAPAPSVEIAKPLAPVDVAKVENTPLEVKGPLPALMTPKQETLALPAPAVKTAEPPRQTKVTIPPVSMSTVKIDPAPMEVKSAPLPLMTPGPDATAAPVVKPTEAARAVEAARPVAPVSVAKTETPPIVEVIPGPVMASPVTPSKPVEMPAGEQLALLTKKPVEVVPPKPVVARPTAKPLEGFIIQLAFSDKEKAQRWAESMEKRGYAVSLTEAGMEGSLRVRLGNFSVRDDAERQLRTLKQEGMNGIIINLPQAFRPQARTSIP